MRAQNQHLEGEDYICAHDSALCIYATIQTIIWDAFTKAYIRTNPLCNANLYMLGLTNRAIRVACQPRIIT